MSSHTLLNPAEAIPMGGPDFPVQMVNIRTPEGNVEQLVAGDFPPQDPWSQHARETLDKLGDEGLLVDREFVEPGGGDGRNGLWVALPNGASRYTTVELQAWRGKLSAVNARILGRSQQTEQVTGDAVAWLQSAPADRFGGAVIFACLPQVPVSQETESVADGIVPQASFGDIGQVELGGVTVDEAGLTLVASSLVALRGTIVTDSNVDGLFVLSNRLADGVIDRLWSETGWSVTGQYVTLKPVPQDIDTSLDIYAEHDDGHRFFTADGTPMSAVVAEARREAAVDAQANSAPLPQDYPHHNVSVYHVQRA